jgi:cell division protein ZapA
VSTEAKGVSITIAGREFRVACPEGEEKQLQASVEFLNRKMKEVRDVGKVVGNDRIAVMAALNIAHEFLSTKLGSGFDIGQAKRRISLIEAKLDEALAKQDKLF